MVYISHPHPIEGIKYIDSLIMSHQLIKIDSIQDDGANAYLVNLP